MQNNVQLSSASSEPEECLQYRAQENVENARTLVLNSLRLHSLIYNRTTP